MQQENGLMLLSVELSPGAKLSDYGSVTTYGPMIVIALTGSMHPPTGGSIREGTVNNVPRHVVDDDLTDPEVYLKS